MRRSAQSARAEIDALKRGFEERARFDICRDGTHAQVAEYNEQKRAQTSALNVHHFTGHGPNAVAPEVLSREDAEHRVIAFERSMRAAGVDGDALAVKMAWFRSTVEPLVAEA